jgi:penicillin-binding protein 1C
VHNGAVMVVDNRTREVLAYVGSPDFDDDRHEGQVNGARVLRSPGSLLKPFLYARGLEEGLITPRRLVFDIERRYDGYATVNFDRHFWGPLPAEESLAMSLNIPAVQMEYELAGRGLASLLRSTRLFGDRLDRANPGLSLALGAFPMTLEELVTLYASLADGGMLRGLHFTLNDPVSPALRPILSPGAAHITVQMLARLLRPDLPQSWEFTANRGRFAYKTGTSFGLRDAWSVGVTPNHTVGVWLGNANARGSSALVGSRAAAPLLTDVMNELTRTRDVWFRSPPEVATRTVCAVSGDPVGPHCPTTLTDAFLPGRSPTAVCALHAVRFVDRRTGRDACRACRTGRPSDYVERPVLRWPPEVAAYLRRQGKPPPPLPAHNPRCPRVDATGGLAIQSPRPNGDYALTGALPGESQKLTLRVDSDRGEEDVFWFLDGVLLGRRRPDDAMAVDPTAGAHVVEVYTPGGSPTA